jgi:hypothetical protein
MTPGVFELDTSIASGLVTYPMKVTYRPSVDRFSASSDFDEKLVTMWSPSSPEPFRDPSGSRSVLSSRPDGVSWSRKIGDVTPKLPSARSFPHNQVNPP